MTLAVCYHARIQARGKYETKICEVIASPLNKMDPKTFQQEITR